MKTFRILPLYLWIPAALFGLAGCFEPSARDLDSLDKKEDLFLDRETSEPYSGAVVQLFEDDSTRIRTSGMLQEGRLQGPWKEYYESGALQLSATYVNGKLDGSMEGYFEDGSIWLRRRHVAGQAEGRWEQYHENGRLRSLTEYAGGQLHGRVKWYYDDGRLRLEGAYEEGKPCGEWTASERKLTYPTCTSG